MSVSRPSRRDEFEIAIICALPLEYDAVSYTFDEFWDQDGDQYGRARNDPNTYTTGRIGNSNVVLALLSRMGKTNAASAAASIAMSYSGLRMALLVGVCGAAPRNGDEEILLGDVVISSSVIEYDFGRQYPDKFVRKDTLPDSHGRPNKDIRSLLVTLETDRGLDRLEQGSISFLQKLQAAVSKTKHRGKYGYPGTSEDTLFETTHRHKHHGLTSCACRDCFNDSDPVCEKAINLACVDLGCNNGPVVDRERLRAKQRAERDGESIAQHPAVHIGLVASGDKVMKSASERDRLSKEEGVIAFDMEGAGVWDELPCIIIKGVCDYADSHKNKKWQRFAAATAASTTKALLKCSIKADKPGSNPTFSESAATDAFKDAIRILNRITASQDQGHDTSILATKFDIEKYFLLQWAERVKLLERNFDERLRNPDTQDSITNVLARIRGLADTAHMEQVYGINRRGGISTPTNTQNDVPTMCSPSLDRLGFASGDSGVNSSSRNRPTHTRGEASTAEDVSAEEARWVIQDNEKFGTFVAELARCTMMLRDAVLPTSESNTRKDLEEIRDLGHLKVVMEAATDHLTTIAEPTREIIDRRCIKRILSTLWFRMIDDRRETIPDAHRETFRWALNPPTDDHPWDDLSHWLRAGTGIYWISGKAGSGKSTLMKYLFSSTETKILLSEWAGDSPCTMVDFFFWYLGTPEQKTQDGLSRALLHKILSSHPKLIPKALPTMWKEAYDGRKMIASPTTAEAEKAFKVISTSPHLGRFCLFIDGLDEYLGNYQDGISFVKSLAAGQNVKVIVSSRPIPDCIASFRELPQLDLPDLTRPDIYAYVQDVIGKHPDMARLSEEDPCGSEQIISDLVDKSSGVFLWVILASRSLISGLARYDDTAELQSRVDDLPPELEAMFQHMLLKIEPRYRNQASRLLRVCYAEQEAREWVKVDRIHALGLALVANNDFKTPLIEAWSEEKKVRLCQRLEGRLRSLCGGLLEVVKRCTTDAEPKFCFCGPIHDDCVDMEVRFMHRTVFEFLRDETVWKLDCLRMESDCEFDVATDLSLIRLHLAMQSLQKQSPRPGQAVSCLRDGVRWGSRADNDAPLNRENIFWKMVPFLDSLHAQKFIKNPHLFRLANAHHDRVDQFSHATLALAAEAGAVNYLKEHPCLLTAAEEGKPKCRCLPLFFYAIHDESLVHIYWDDPLSPPWLRACSSDAVVRLLLSAGCDPNKFAPGSYRSRTLMTSPWTLWLENKHQKLGATVPEKLSALTTIESFVAAGATARPGVLFDVETWIKETFRDPELVEKSQSVLQRFREVKTDFVVGARRRRPDPDESGDREP
ncbi:hypothetical protein CEP54_008277 [Fusarium duplospermum]|uniref:Nucleoside phosphorylase domain-containing protein n=1 Tax=Fusarium duplospermum TaxID=1325734 RepID=A0A428PWL1_9HYPO|nr:hypothetical protein CEP54_008277 [Fusarium duplospermum]